MLASIFLSLTMLLTDVTGINWKAVEAVRIIESGPRVEKRPFPLMRFEQTIFNRLTKHAKSIRTVKVKPKLFANSEQERQFRKFLAAAAIDYRAALMATSWGDFQILGMNYLLAGFDSPESMVESFILCPRVQVRAFLNFTQAVGIMNILKQERPNWSKFAEYYNGKQYWKTAYHLRIGRVFNDLRIGYQVEEATDTCRGQGGLGWVQSNDFSPTKDCEAWTKILCGGLWVISQPTDSY